MELKKLSNNIFYYPHQLDTDRPMLAYVKGHKFSLAIDSGNSSNHIKEFYESLKDKSLTKPNFTAITHWHWDHTFGMHQVHGYTIACYKTNEFLRKEGSKLSNDTYIDFLKEDDECLGKEYANGEEIIAIPSDIEFNEEITLDLGGITAKIFHAISPHSEDSVLIYIPEEKTLFLGDSTSEDFYNDGYMDKNKLSSLIKVIENMDCKYCILSHTEPLAKQDLLNYLYSL